MMTMMKLKVQTSLLTLENVSQLFYCSQRVSPDVLIPDVKIGIDPKFTGYLVHFRRIESNEEKYWTPSTLIQLSIKHIGMFDKKNSALSDLTLHSLSRRDFLQEIISQ